MSKYYTEDNGFNFGVSKKRTASQTYIVDQDLALTSRLISEGLKSIGYKQRVYNLAVVKRFLTSGFLER